MNIGFTDITANISGLNMSVTRQYSSFNKEKGDFGVGWTLGLNSIQMYEGSKLGANWEHIQKKAYPFPSYSFNPTTSHDVVITYGDGTSDTFEVVLDYKGQTPIVPIRILDATYRCKTNSKVKLEIVGNKTMECIGSLGATTFFPEGEYYSLDQPMDPQVFKLTTEDGAEIIFHKQNGIQSITDKNGNQITIDKNGITNSTGKSIVFTRDSEERIISATDLAGNVTRYVYDNNGDLVEVINPLNQSVKFVYDNEHNLAQIIDPRGIAIARNEYDENGRLVASIDAKGNRMEYSHDVEGRQEIVKDRLGNTIVLIYDESGKVLSETNSLGYKVSYTYDEEGNIRTFTDEEGNVSYFTYDANNNLAELVNALGNKIQYTYNDFGKMLSEIDAEGNKCYREYDNKGNLTAEIDKSGNSIKYEYSSKGNLSGIIDFSGNSLKFIYDTYGRLITEEEYFGTTSYTYDQNDNITSIEKKDITTGEVTTTQYEYDAINRVVKSIDTQGNIIEVEYNLNGNISAKTDEGGQKIQYIYDDYGNIVKIIYPDQTVNEFTYDLENRKLSETDREGNTTYFVYDVLGRIVMEKYPDQSYKEFKYDPRGNIYQTIDENQNIIEYMYNAVGNNTAIKDALGNITTFEYSPNGLLTKKTDPNGYKIQYQYNDNSRLEKVVFEDNSTILYGYDSIGNKVTETDQDGNTTKYTYNEMYQLTSVIDALENVTTYTYEGDKLLKQKDANGNEVNYAYDELGRMIETTLPLGMKNRYIYNRFNQIESYTDFNGQITKWEYDNEQRLKDKKYDDDTQETYTYYPSGRVKTVTNQNGTVAFEYNSRGKLIKQVNADGTSLTYTYDKVGNKTSTTSVFGTTCYTYDALNRLKNVTDEKGQVTTYAYDKVGNRTSITYPNGNIVTYSYDNLNRLVSEKITKNNGQAIATYEYVLKASGNREKIIESTGRVIEYTYDNTSRLLQEKILESNGKETQIDYTYDKVGNRLTKFQNNQLTKYSYDLNDQLIKEDDKTYTYDANGNMTKAYDALGNRTIYEYSINNRLIGVQGDTTIKYTYDFEGNRIGNSVNGSISKYIVDSNTQYPNVLGELDANNNAIASYTYGDDLISQERSQQTYFYMYDGQLSTRYLTDEKGEVTDTYDYYAFGEIANKVGDTPNEYLYVSQQYDQNIGFYYLRARYMNPSNGRFISRDTYSGSIYDPVTLHKYTYANNNPVINWDPNGLWGEVIKGILAHWYIEESYYVGHPNNRQNRDRKAAYIPGGGKNGGAGYPDIIDYTLQDIYEIKPNNAIAIASGKWQVENYLSVLYYLEGLEVQFEDETMTINVKKMKKGRLWPHGPQAVAWPFGGGFTYQLDSPGLIVYEIEDDNPPNSYAWALLGEYKKRIARCFTMEEIGALAELTGPLVGIVTAAAIVQYKVDYSFAILLPF